MELIKKTVQRAMTTGLTATTTGYSYIIIPDINAVYHFKILLTNELQDMGFFDADVESFFFEPPIAKKIVITGNTNTSRLSELRKYTTSNIFANQYIGGGSFVNDGVDYSASISGVSVTYYLGGIKYIDDVANGITTFVYTPSGTSSPDFINAPYYKDPQKENIISNPKIINDVFIVRQELSAFENNYRLEHIKNLNELLTYAGGKYFNIVSNT
jgi:hypothetical protein